MITLGRGGSRASDYITLAPKPKPPATPKPPAAPKPPAVSPVMRTASARTPVAATDSTGATIDGAYIENGQTYFGNGTRIGEGTTVIDDSGREWVKGPGSGGGTLTGNNFGIDWEDEYNTGGGTGGTANDYYDNLLTEQQKAAQARIDAALDANNAYIPKINQQSDKRLQDAYISKEMNRVNLPQQLSALGYSGGATETSLTGEKTRYENSRNSIEQDRGDALSNIYANAAQIEATGNADLADVAAQYYQNLIAKQQQDEATAQSNYRWQTEFGADQTQTAYENQIKMAQYKASLGDYSGLQSLGIKTSSMNDYDGSTPTRKASSSSSSSSYGTANTSSGNYNTVLTNVKRALGGSNAGSSAAWDQAVNYIQNSLRQRTITEYEAQQMLSQLGLD
jgi:hypothetical protein